LLGILCDGENYRQTKTARDREIVQNSVLKLLGWNIYKVWTMDWWENPKAVVKQILQAIKDAENSPKAPATSKNSGEIKTATHDMTLAGNQQSIPQVKVVPETIVIEQEESDFKLPYDSAILSNSKYLPENFMLPEYKHIIIAQLKQVIVVEAPISRALLCKKVLNSWGISRLGQRLDSYFEALFASLSYFQSKNDNIVFFWIDKEHCESFKFYRPDSNRDAVDLPPAEVANAIKQIIEEQISMPTPDLAKLTAQLFNFSRSGTNVEASMHRGIDEAIKRNYMKVENGKAVIL